MARALTGLLVALALFAAVAGAAVAWLAGTEAGLRWLVARAESSSAGSLKIEEVSGNLAHEVSIGRLRYAGEALSIEARELRGRGDLIALLRGQIGIEPLRAQSLEVAMAGSPPKPGPRNAPPAPLPFGLRLAQVEIGRVELVRGSARHALSDVRLMHLEFAAHSLSASASFSRPDERFPMTGNLQVRGTLERLDASLAVNIAGMAAEAKATLAPFEPLVLRSLDARAGPVDLARIDPELPHTALTAVLKATASRDLLAGTLSLSNAAAGPLDEGALPVASAQTRFASRDLSSAALDALRIVLRGGGTLQGRGELGRDHFSAVVEAADINLRAIHTTLRQTALHGALNLVLTRDEQSVRGTLSQAGMTLGAHIVRNGQTLDVRALRAEAGGGEVTGSGKIRLSEPLELEAQLKLSGFDPAAFGEYPDGSISGTLDAKGKLGDAPQVDAQWAIAGSTLVGHALESRGSARFSRQRITRAMAEASLGGSRATARGDFGRPGDRLDLTLDVASLEEHVPELAGHMKAIGFLGGRWDDPELQASAQMEALQLPGGFVLDSARATLSGTRGRHDAALYANTQDAQAEARLRGGWHAERGWEGEIGSLTNAGAYPLRLIAPAPLNASRRRVALGRFEAALGEGRLLVHELAWEKGRLSTSGEFSGLPAHWLVLAAGVGGRLRATMLLNGQWSLSAAPRLQGSVQARRASGDFALLDESGPIPLALNEMALDARFDDGRVSASIDAASRYGSVALEADVTPARDAAGLGIGRESALSMRARIDAADISVLTQPLLAHARLDGRLAAELVGSGTLGEPKITGTLRGDGISAEMPPYGVFLRNGSLRATIDGKSLHISGFTIQGGSGEFTARGSLPLRFADGGAKLVWSAHNFGVLERPDLRLVVSGKGEAGFDGKRLFLTGSVRAERGHLSIERERLPRLGEDVVIEGQPPKDAGARAQVPASLDLQLDLGQNLTIAGEGLEGRLTGRLQLTSGKDGELRAHGRLQMVNATFLAYGQRLQIDPGVLLFDGPLDNPALQITAWRRNLPVEPGVQVTGTVLAPHMQLVSQPLVPEGERLSWLVLGRAPSDATKADLGMLQAAAGALLARGDSLPLDRQIARAFGLDEVSFRGSGEVQDRVVAFGKRLSDRLYVSYEQGLGAVVSNLVKLDYSLSRHWSLRAETGTSSGAGLFYRFSWD